jgi:tetratricopeptide (TPR) repeat protein
MPSPGQVGVDFRAVRLKAALRLLRILSEQNRTNEALAEVQSALAAFPGRPEIFLMAGKTLLLQDRLMEALKSFEKSIFLASQKNIDSYIGLCLIYQKAKRMETAHQSFESIKSLFSSSPRYWAFKRYFLEDIEAQTGFTKLELEKEWGLIKRDFFIGQK